MEKKIYMHALSQDDKYDQTLSVSKLNKILRKKQLLSLRKQRALVSNNNFGGIDYISLCDYDLMKQYSGEDSTYNAYNIYIRKFLSIILDGNQIETIKPIIIDPIPHTVEGYRLMDKLGRDKSNRYSDMADEVQVRDSVSLEHMISVSIPTVELSKGYINKETIEFIKIEIEKVYRSLNKYHYDVPAVDIDTFKELETKDDIEMVLKKQLTNQ